MRARALALAAALAAASCRAAPEPPAPQPPRPPLGLMTTLPLIWGEAEAFGDLLRSDGEASWIKPALESRFVLRPLDALDPATLAPLRYLMLAQPRALGPAENVALDDWVRGGGRLLLFADPMLTRHSRFPVGDPRRPQDVALLSPILARWGLALEFAAEQRAGERIVEAAGTAIPAHLAGSFRTTAGGSCRISGAGLVAVCAIGRGRVVALADAAMLDDPGDARADALQRMLDLAFP